MQRSLYSKDGKHLKNFAISGVKNTESILYVGLSHAEATEEAEMARAVQNFQGETRCFSLEAIHFGFPRKPENTQSLAPVLPYSIGMLWLNQTTARNRPLEAHIEMNQKLRA